MVTLTKQFLELPNDPLKEEMLISAFDIINQLILKQGLELKTEKNIRDMVILHFSF